ncbi:MAG: ComEC/Rec2 family competence protein [bacterium]|nr:ComEC/Rec2 family competence protein [bacterium]
MKSIFTVKQRVGLLVTGILILGNIFAWQEVFALAGPHYLKVNVLGIGQGDSIFIETPARHQIVIDGGPDSLVLGKLQQRLPFWDRSLDLVILTHPDKDHVMGLLSVLQKYKVDYILWTGIIRNGETYQEWLKLVSETEKKGTRVIKANAGQKIVSGEVVIETLHPLEDVAGQDFKEESNDSSIFSRLVYGSRSFLFTGDASSKVESKLISQGIDVDSDVLKVGHHGSRFSTSDAFLQAVSPDIAVISAGKKNSYGHPTPEVLQRLEKFGITVFRTDKDGDVEIISDGTNINIK